MRKFLRAASGASLSIGSAGAEALLRLCAFEHHKADIAAGREMVLSEFKGGGAGLLKRAIPIQADVIGLPLIQSQMKPPNPPALPPGGSYNPCSRNHHRKSGDAKKSVPAPC